MRDFDREPQHESDDRASQPPAGVGDLVAEALVLDVGVGDARGFGDGRVADVGNRAGDRVGGGDGRIKRNRRPTTGQVHLTRFYTVDRAHRLLDVRDATRAVHSVYGQSGFGRLGVIGQGLGHIVSNLSLTPR